jgi:hypothetical protein
MKRTVAAGLLLVSCAACARSQPAPAASSAPIAPAPAHVPASSAPTASGIVVTGPVVETFDAASYTYLRVRGPNGDVWAAAPQFAVKAGDEVRVPLEMPMRNFHSASLNRDFPLIYFVSRVRSAGAAVAAATDPAAGAHGSRAGQPSAVTTPMPPPSGGKTIADVWSERKPLAGTPVTIHGVVVKYNPGILGVNWIHLQDGTGTAADGSNDITVTTADDPGLAVGDTLTVTGTVTLDKDIGSGYAYPVLVEHARIVSLKKTAGS